MRHLNIALVAHDGRKQEFIEWARQNTAVLSQHNLYATGTTGRLVSEIVTDDGNRPFGNKITRLLSGPLGGDQQIGAMIAEHRIDMLIFFCDNLMVQGHQNDISALSRLASLYNIAFATNRTTADLMLSSTLLDDDSYVMTTPGCISKYAGRDVSNA